MARLKAKVNEKWITGDNAQQLVNNALAAHHTPVCGKSFRDYANHFIALYKARERLHKAPFLFDQPAGPPHHCHVYE